jgi:ArsR family transcriptional regulator
VAAPLPRSIPDADSSIIYEFATHRLAAGDVAQTLGIAPNTLSFHFDRLRHAGLVSVTRDGRSMIYAARYETMNALLAFLTRNCCTGVPSSRKAKTNARKLSEQET